MKQYLLKTLVTCLLLVGAVSLSFAGTYATSIRVTNPDSITAFDGSFADGSGARIWFTLNAHADTVKIWAVAMGPNPARVKTFAPIVNLGAGQYNVLWDGKNDAATVVPLGNYSFEVFASDTGNSTANWVQAWENPVYLLTGGGLSCRDIDVVRDPSSPAFGNLIITEASTTYGYARMLMAQANGSLITEYSRSLFPQGSSDFDPWFISIANNGKQYVTSSTLNSILVYKDSVLMSTIKDLVKIGSPKGIATAGNGDPTLFIATGKAVVRRTPAGVVDTIFADTNALGYTRDIAIDDSGYVFIAFGTSSSVYTKVVRLSRTFVPMDTLTLPDNVTHINIFKGGNAASNVDDILYARVRGANGGVFKLDFAGKASTKLFAPSTSTSGSHSIGIDVLGNIYYANPSTEWVRMYIPPTTPARNFTTKGGSLNVLPVASKVIDAFDTGLGHFSLAPNYSGSTVGIISTSATQWNQSEKTSGFGGSIEINLQDDPAVTTAWAVRFLSGGGATGANDSLGAVGFVGYWLKTSTAPKGAQVAIGMDDPSDPTTKRSVPVSVVNDGEWHLYQWNIADSTQWTAWVANSPKIKGPRVSIDAVWFFAPDSSAPWKIFMDNVAYNPGGPLGNEPGRGDVTNNGVASPLDASWILQNVVNIRPFTPQQLIAGDVNLSHNGSAVNAVDASIILANVVGKISFLPWKQPLPPLVNINQDQPAPLSMMIASASGTAGKIVMIPISIPGELAGLRSAEMEVTYNASALKIRNVTSTDLTKDFAVVSNIKDGAVSIAMASGDAIANGGQILMIEAEILQSSENISMTIDKIQLNDRSISKVTSVGSRTTEIPQTFALLQNYPNPFNPSTVIEYQLPQNSFVELKVYDITGREVTTLVSEMKNAGSHSISWNAVDAQGSKVSSGIYFYRINAGSFSQIKKMMLLK